MARVDDYQSALNLARERLARMNPKRLAAHCGGTFLAEGKGTIQMRFLGRDIRVRFDEITVEPEEGKTEGDIPIQEQVLILHYLLGCGGTPPSGKLITYREIPSGEFYFPAFKKRAIDPLVRVFGSDPDLFRRAAFTMGGVERPDLSGQAYLFLPLPKIPTVLQIHEADEEFPADGNILFDEIVADTLSLEDTAWLAGMLVYRLMGVARSVKPDKPQK